MTEYRSLFTAYKNSGLSYLDSASTTQKPDAVIATVQTYLTELAANPSRGSYAAAVVREKGITETRQKVARFVGAASATDIVFTSGATEGINAVMYAWAAHTLADGDEILLCRDDHQSTVLPWVHLQRLLASRGVHIRLRYYEHTPYTGGVDMQSVRSQLSLQTRLVVATHIHNIFGTAIDTKELRQIAGDVPILLDASQSIAHIPIDVQAMGMDFMVFSGHKMFAIEGSGALYISPARQSELQSFIVGSKGSVRTDDSPSALLESGTPNTMGILSLGAAVDFMTQIGIENICSYIDGLMSALYDSLASHPGIQFLPGFAHNPSAGSYGILACRIAGKQSSDVGEYLGAEGVLLRAGSHCSADESSVEDSLRISLQIYNTKQDIYRLREALDKV